MRETPRARLVAYGVPVLATGLSLLIRLPLVPWLGYHAEVMTFFPAIILSAYFGGLGPGLLATFLGAAAGDYFFFEPQHSFAIGDLGTGYGLGLFVLTGAVISILMESLHRWRRRIAASERRYAVTLGSIGDAVIATDTQTRVTFLNATAEALTGWPLADAVGRPLPEVFRIVNEQTRQPMEDPAAKVLRTGTVVGLANHTALLARDGRETPIDDCGAPIIDDRGAIAGVVLVFRDVSQRRCAEEAEAFRKSEQRWRSLTEALPQLVWSAAPDGTCDYFSTQWTEHTGVAEADLLGWRWLETLHPEDREPTRQFWLGSVAGCHPYDVEYRVRRRDGEYRWFKTRGVPVHDQSGQVIKWLGTCTDVDDQKRAEEGERRAREAAEAANRAKDEFLANVSHEIRTPMNAILGMTELALDTELSDDQRQCLQTVKSAADNLLGIINALLDFAKIEAGKLELAPADFSLRTAVGDTLRALAVRAHKKGIELIHSVRPEVPDALVGDAGRLRQVLLNLVGNAIKFTDAGEVVVSVRTEDRGLRTESEALNPQSSVLITFEVRDTGIGIPRDQQERIFRAFEQQDTSTTRKYEGTGLGLTIASRLVALMGGQITVDSEPGQGSTFAFTAHFGRRPHQPAPDTSRQPVLHHNLNVLVVDDNATNRHILQEWLRGWQMQSAAVGDGLAALDALWGAVNMGRPYALVLLDARMPDTDGLTLAEKIRKRAELSTTRIILLTSGDRPGDLARSREQRVDAHLLKPVQQDELLKTIYRVMSRTEDDKVTGWQGDRVTADSPQPVTLSVLVAEDNEFNAQLLEQLLGRRGHRVRLASNGRQALGLAEEGGFDLLLLDVHMPELDGFQVVQAIRERERTTGGHLPIIALTARSRREDRESCLAAGMDDFLAKPIQATDLWAAIERVAGKDSASPATRHAPPATQLLDPQVILAACGGDPAILEKICQTFRARLPDHLKAVQDAFRDRDAPKLRDTAHKLTGMVAAFSTVAGGVASELEDRAAQGQLEEAGPLAARLETMVEELLRLVGGPQQSLQRILDIGVQCAHGK
jgi:PAS domain S-box-containing protein